MFLCLLTDENITARLVCHCNTYRTYKSVEYTSPVPQIAYLENLLKVYNDEIMKLQQRDLGLDDLEKEDSSYIQEHKLKRKVSWF